MSTERNPLAWGNLEPNRLWSLWEMIELNAPKLHHLLSLTISTELSLTYSRWQNSSGGVTFDLLGATHGDSYAEYDMQISILEELGFLASAAALKRAKVCMQEMSDPTKSYAQNQDRLERLFTDFRHRLFDELKAPHFLVLLPAERSLFQPEAPLFGQSVHDAFPSSRNDIEDAGKCMALEQNTAAVLLLMRALEPALISLQTEVGASVPKDQWHQMINQIESAIEQMRVDLHSQKPPVHGRTATKDELAWFSDLAIHFRYMKDAWRNYAAHGKTRYDRQQARRIYDNVKDFMGEAASRLREAP